ncbi:hypothetical protein ACJJTC_012656 [Scirpophaga incertulas]
MAALLQPLQLLCILVAVLAELTLLGRIPKVYNALITLQSKLGAQQGIPVYQPVLHDFTFPFQPAVFYGDFPIGNGLQPVPVAAPKDPSITQPGSESPPQEPLDVKPAPTESPVSTPAASSPNPEDNKPTQAPPLPPNTQSPIPLNQFGLPSQVLPLGRINPAYNGFNQVGPFTYSYPGFRFYDPFEPFTINPFVSIPSIYRPLPNVLEQNSPGVFAAVETPSEPSPTPAPQATQTPPSEPSASIS